MDHLHSTSSTHVSSGYTRLELHVSLRHDHTPMLYSRITRNSSQSARECISKRRQRLGLQRFREGKAGHCSVSVCVRVDGSHRSMTLGIYVAAYLAISIVVFRRTDICHRLLQGGNPTCRELFITTRTSYFTRHEACDRSRFQTRHWHDASETWDDSKTARLTAFPERSVTRQTHDMFPTAAVLRRSTWKGASMVKRGNFP